MELIYINIVFHANPTDTLERLALTVAHILIVIRKLYAGDANARHDSGAATIALKL